MVGAALFQKPLIRAGFAEAWDFAIAIEFRGDLGIFLGSQNLTAGFIRNELTLRCDVLRG